MKYIVDIEALKDCLELLPQCKVNGEPYVCLESIYMLIDRFPKEDAGNFLDNLKRLGVIKT